MFFYLVLVINLSISHRPWPHTSYSPSQVYISPAKADHFSHTAIHWAFRSVSGKMMYCAKRSVTDSPFGFFGWLCIALLGVGFMLGIDFGCGVGSSVLFTLGVGRNWLTLLGFPFLGLINYTLEFGKPQLCVPSHWALWSLQSNHNLIN